MGIRKYFEDIRDSVTSIFEGMAVTFSWMFRRPHTIQYPDRYDRSRPLTQNRFRGLLEVDLSICTACLACQRACPIGVISVEVSKGVERSITRFDIDASKCMYCGLCTEACPTGSIRHTGEFAYSVDDIRKLILHFVHEPVMPYRPQKDIPPKASINRGEAVLRIISRREEPYSPYLSQQIPLIKREESEEGKG